MNAQPSVEVLLDLRAWSHPVTGPQELIALWQRLETSLVGQRVQPGGLFTLKQGANDRVVVTVLTVPPGAERVTPETRFAIHNVLERPAVGYACSVCSNKGRQRYGPLFCFSSARQGRIARLCPECAIILDGNMRAYHPDHVPLCKSGNGKQATFWCRGPLCGYGEAWSEEYRVLHPRFREVFHCRDCHQELFARCAYPGCRNFRDGRCEFVDPVSGHACRFPVCAARHLYFWQVYGAEKEGLILCPRHNETVHAQSDAEVICQIALGTAARRLRWKHQPDAELPFLPRLARFRYIFIKLRPTARPYAYQLLVDLLKNLSQWKGNATPLDREVRLLIDNRWPQWQQELEGVGDLLVQGVPYLEQIKQVYREMGMDKVAEGLRLSDFKPPSGDRTEPLLYLEVEEGVRPLFFRNRRAVEQRLRVLIAKERGS